MATMGRPKKEIDADQFEKLCGLQCTLTEIASYFHCSEDTVERWCKRNYSLTFAEAYKKHSGSGKISLRRAQFRLAEKSAAMAIWLGKQYLNQRDSGGDPFGGEDSQAEDSLSKSLRELSEGLQSDDK